MKSAGERLIQQGIEQGIKQGMEQGIEHVAESMLRRGMDIGVVAEILKPPHKELQKLKT